jgi:hypothetical protein
MLVGGLGLKGILRQRVVFGRRLLMQSIILGSQISCAVKILILQFFGRVLCGLIKQLSVDINGM